MSTISMEPSEFRSSFERPPAPQPEQRVDFDTRASSQERSEHKPPTEHGRSPEKNTQAEHGKKRFFNPLRKQTTVRPLGKDELDVKIEKILEENIADSYQNLSPSGKQAFKIKGERTAAHIKELLQSGQVKARKILDLIVEWLRMLPGVNRFFIEQEAKIKTDSMMKLLRNK